MKGRVYILAVLSLVAGRAAGDATVARSLKLTPASGEGILEARSLQQTRAQTSRRETDIVTEGIFPDAFKPPRKTVTLINIEKGKVHHLEFPQTSFEEMSISRWRKDHAPQASDSKSTRRINRSWSRALPDEESQTLRGFPCTKFVYEWHFEVEDTETYDKKQYVVRNTLWLTDISPLVQQLLFEETLFSQSYHERMGGRPLEGLNALTLHYAAAVTGMDQDVLFAELSYGTTRLKEIKGYLVASQSEWFRVGSKENKPLFTIDSQLDSFSLSPLAAAVFAPTYQYDPLTDLLESARSLSQAK